MMNSYERPRSTLFYSLCLFSIFVIIAAAGGSLIWAKSLVLIAVGLLLVFDTPSYSLGKLVNFIFLGLFLTAFAVFLPADLLPHGSWREMAIKDYGFKLQSYLTVNPLLTIESLVEFMALAGWFYWCSNQVYSRRIRRSLLCIFSVVVTLFAVVLIIGNMLHIKYIWASNSAINFTYFPNKNQSGTLFAVGGIVSIGLVFYYIKRNIYLAVFFAVCTLLLFLAIVYSYSRAAIIVFALGVLVTYFQKYNKNDWRDYIKIGLIVLFICIGLLFQYGNGLVEKYSHFINGDDFRLKAYLDCIDSIKDHFLVGFGLGNFENIFVHYRTRTLADNRMLHPESDYLWFASELGVIGLLLLLLLLFISIKKYFPVVPGKKGEILRLIAFSCVIAFAFNSIIDVPFHVYGTSLLIIFIYSLSISDEKRFDRLLNIYGKSVLRIIGLILILFGSIWFYSYKYKSPLHSKFIRNKNIKEVIRYSHTKNVYDFIDVYNKAIEYNPFEWSYHYYMALVYLEKLNDISSAYKVFRKIEFIMPMNSRMSFEEGTIWLKAHEYRYAYKAFKNALTRNPWSEEGVLTDIKRALISYNDFEYYDDLIRLTPDLYFNNVLINNNIDSTIIELEQILQRDENLVGLSDEKIERLIEKLINESLSLKSIDLIYKIKRNNNYEWYYQFVAKGIEEDYQEAFSILDKNMPVAADLSNIAYGSLRELELQYRQNPTDYRKGILLLKRYIDESDLNKANALIDDMYQRYKDVYIIVFWKTKVLRLQGEYKEAWSVWINYFKGNYKVRINRLSNDPES